MTQVAVATMLAPAQIHPAQAHLLFTEIGHAFWPFDRCKKKQNSIS